MERFALDKISEGILFIQILNGNIILDYANEASFFLLGVKTKDWLSAFSEQVKVENCIRSCILTKQNSEEWFQVGLYLVFCRMLVYEDKLVIILSSRIPNCSSSEFISNTFVNGVNLQTNLKEKFQCLFKSSSAEDMKSLESECCTIYSELERKLKEKKKELEERDESYQLMKCFFEQSKFPMGTIEIIGDWSDFQYLIINSAGKLSLSHNVNEELSFRKGRDIVNQCIFDVWMQKFKDCDINGGPIFFEIVGPGGKKYSNTIMKVKEKRFSWISVDITHINNLETEVKKLKDNLEILVKERTKELEEALQIKGRFLATMSHELRTPISGISGSLQILSETVLTSEQFDSIYVANICTQQLLTVVNDVLDLSKLEEQKMQLEELPFSLCETVNEAIQIVALEAEKKSLDIVCDVGVNLPTRYIGDPVRLRQILVNLLSNAVKFSQKGTIIVQVRASALIDGKTEIQFGVRDEGIGISEQAKSTLFQPFTQADSSTSRKYGGTGLGLTICKKLSELMGGRIWFESEIGSGTTFYFTIRALMIRAEPIESIEELSEKKIVSVSDNIHRLQNAHTIFSAHGVSSEEFPSLKEAQESIEKIKSENPLKEIILLIDCNLLDSESLVPYQLSKYCKVIMLGFSHQIMRWAVKPNLLLLKKPLRLKPLISLIKEHSKTLVVKKSNEKFPNTKILVAEDNILNQHVIGKMLANLGFDNFQFADNGKLAVEAAVKNNFDIILMDIMMPEMGGIEAMHLIRNQAGNKSVIIALTADVLTEPGKLSSFEFDDILYKPIDKPKFCSVLQKYKK